MVTKERGSDMRNLFSRIFFTVITTFIALTLFFSNTVYAYLDPGMGTMLLQLLAGAALFIGIGWRYIIRFFKKLIKKFNKNENKDNEKV